MKSSIKDPGGSKVINDPGGGGAGYEKDPGGWKIILDPGTGV
ncbi:hypothetical protein ACLBWW_25845 [Bacillus sp. M5A3_1b]|nr:hypothetical protein [Bacillus wiedmannii]